MILKRKLLIITHIVVLTMPSKSAGKINIGDYFVVPEKNVVPDGAGAAVDAPAGVGQIELAVLTDVSGSMSSYQQQMIDNLVALMEHRDPKVRFRVRVVPFGPRGQGAIFDYRTHRTFNLKTVWDSVADVRRYCRTDFGTYTEYILNLRYVNPNLLLIFSDGEFSDNQFMDRVRQLSTQGHLRQLSKILIVFRPGTEARTVRSMETEWRQFLTADQNVACRAPEIHALRAMTRNTFLDLVKPHLGTVKTINFPPEWKKPVNIAGVVGINGDKPISEIGTLLTAQHPEILNDIWTALKGVIEDTPRVINDPANCWSTVHRLLILSGLKDLYHAWFVKFKNTHPDPAIKKMLNEMALKSFKDSGAVLKKIKALEENGRCTDHVMWCTADMTEEEIAHVIQRKKTGGLIDRMFTGGVCLRKKSTLKKDELAMPITHPDDHRSCLTALSLLFLQWGDEYSLNKDLLTVIVFDLCAYFILAEDIGNLGPLKTMINRVICEEQWLAKELGYDTDLEEFVLSEKPLLFTRYNIKNIGLVLTVLKKEIFKSTYSAVEGMKIPIEKVEGLIRKFRKLDNYQDSARIVRNKHEGFQISRTFAEPIIGKDIPFSTIIGTHDTTLRKDMIVLWPDDSYDGTGREDPKPNLPTIGVVKTSRTFLNRKRTEEFIDCRIQQLDDECFSDGLDVDTVGYTRRHRNLHYVGLRCLVGVASYDQIMNVNSFLMALQGDARIHLIDEKYRQKAVDEATSFFKLNSCSPEDFVEGSRSRGGLRNATTNYIKNKVCVPSDVKYNDVDYTINVPKEVVHAILNLPPGVMEMVKSGANMNMKQALDVLKTPVRGVPVIPSFPFKHYEIKLTGEEIDVISATIKGEIDDMRKRHRPITLLETTTCLYCYDPDLMPYDGIGLDCCGSRFCDECIRPLLERQYEKGSLLEQSMLGCPKCRAPLPHVDGKIKDFFAKHSNSTEILVQKACRVCEDCEQIFEQDNPACGGASIIDATSPVCERCEANRNTDLVAAEAAAGAAGAGVVIWRCPHVGADGVPCDASGTKGAGCDDMECPKCHRHSCAQCSCPFTEEQEEKIADIIAWLCASHPSVGEEKCTEEYIDEYLERNGYYDN